MSDCTPAQNRLKLLIEAQGRKWCSSSSTVVVNVQSVNRSDPYLNATTSPRNISKLYLCYCKIDGLPAIEHCRILHGIRDCDHGVSSSESKVPWLGVNG